MKVSEISIKNLKTNYKNYSLYFFSIIINIIIYYVYYTIITNNKLTDLMGKNNAGLSRFLFKFSSYIIVVFCIIFLWNSTEFFIKKRKKEIGLYSLLGLNNKKIGNMMSNEIIIMGVIALTLGIFIGTIFSQICMKIFMLSIGIKKSIGFIFSIKAVLSTIKTFGILFIIISIRAYRLIFKFKLIDLFKADQKEEEKGNFTGLKGMLSIIFLIGGYFLGSLLGIKIFGANGLFLAVIFVIVGTYLFYNSFFMFFVKLLRKSRLGYKKVEFLVVLSNISHTIKSNAKMLTVITLLNTSIIVGTGTALAFSQMGNSNLNQYKFSYIYLNDKSMNKKVDFILKKHKDKKVNLDSKLNIIKLKDKISSPYVISEKTYNNICKSLNVQEKISLKNKNDVIELNSNKISEKKLTFFEHNNRIKPIEIDNFSKKEKLKVLEYREQIINPDIIGGTLVVKNQLFEELKKIGKSLEFRSLKITNEKDSRLLDEELMNEFKKSKKQISSFYSFYKSSKGIIGSIQFPAFFTSFVFILSTLSIIFFKTMMDQDKESNMYSILKQIGFDNKRIKKCVYRNSCFILGGPLVLGILHSLVALSLFMAFSPISVILTVGLFIVIYILFHFATSNSHFNILKQKI